MAFFALTDSYVRNWNTQGNLLCENVTHYVWTVWPKNNHHSVIRATFSKIYRGQEIEVPCMERHALQSSRAYC